MKIAILFLILFSGSDTVAKINSLENWIEEEIISFTNEENASFKNKLPGPWELEKVRLRVRPLFGLEIPALASFEIKPFIEFHWKASSPQLLDSIKKGLIERP